MIEKYDRDNCSLSSIVLHDKKGLRYLVYVFKEGLFDMMKQNTKQWNPQLLESYDWTHMLL